MLTRTFRLLGVLCVAALVLVACNGDDPDPAAEPDPDAPLEEPATDDEVPEDLFEEPELPAVEAVRITYEATADEHPPDEFIVSWDPPMISVMFDEGRIVHTADDETILCQEQEGETQCTRMPEGQDGPHMVLSSFVPFFGAGVTAETDLPGAEQIDDREIAGRAATCYAIAAPAGPEPEGAEEAGEAELCADQETGATLLYAFSGPEGDQAVEAQSVDSPEAGDFEATGPVEDAPEMPIED
jgi:hypothetical protein